MSPHPGTLCAAAVMLSGAICSGLASMDSAVSEPESTEKRESQYEPMPRESAISRIETRPVPTVNCDDGFARGAHARGGG